MASAGEGDLPLPDLTEHEHHHNFHELVFIAQGHGTHYIDNQIFKVNRGDIFLIQPGQHHYFSDRVNMRHLNVAFDLDNLPLSHELLQKHPGYLPLFTLDPMMRQNRDVIGHLQFAPAQFSAINSIINEMMSMQNRGADSFSMLTLFQQLLIILMDAYALPASRDGKQLLKLSKIINYIELNFDKALTIEELAHRAAMSRSTFIRQFKKATGTSAISYINQLRINQAKERLLNTDLSITEIAYKVGFNDSNYFTRLFKKHTGLPPRNYCRDAS